MVIPEGAVYRATPLFVVASGTASGLIAVGQARVVVRTDGQAHLRLLVRALWARDGDRQWRLVDDHPLLRERLSEWAHRLPDDPSSGATTRATVLSKGLAEASRNALADVAELRYGMERRLAAQLDPRSREALEPVLADAIQLSLALGRAHDEARAAAREGLWAWRTDSAAYHAQRHLLDPTLPRRPEHETAVALPWFGTYDAAVRQCVALEHGVQTAAPLLDRMLGYGATIASARDAQGQEAFNLVAAVATVALGVPALLLSLYGASEVLPLKFDSAGLRVSVPLVVSALIAVVLAVGLPARYARRRRLLYAAVAVVLIVGLLLVSGTLFVSASSGIGP